MQRGFPKVVKVTFDRVAAGTGLILLSPVLGAAALAIWATMGRPILFRQVRPGLKGRPFTLLKLRTMANRTDDTGRDLPDADRLTAVGRFLRSASLDELPQLWNVLRGDLSLVGPRPLLMKYLERYSPEQLRRHDVLPGITGWAQVCGRNQLSWQEKFAFDLWYVDNWSLSLDAKILALTALRVLQRSGVNADEHATMPEFLGNAAPAEGD
ncbi:MAG: sugar transferase [Myxococcales bacterium]|nr:sugar transferase [Myxococcales bacterium]